MGLPAQVGAALSDQLQRQIRPQAVDLGEIYSEDRMERAASVEGLPIPTKPPGCNGIMPPGIPE